MKLFAYYHESNYYTSLNFGIRGIKTNAFSFFYRKNDMMFKYSRVNINSTWSSDARLQFKI